MEEIKQAPHTLESGQGADARQVCSSQDKDSDYQREKQDHPQIIRVGNDVLELITIPDTLGRPHTTLVGRTREVIKERFGNSTLTAAPYYDALAVVPSHTDYKQVVGNCWNIYNRLEIEPNKGEHPMWDMLMKRIFGEQEALGWDYLTLLYRTPTQVLPVLCLVSPENHTGKSSFGNALSYLFGANVGFYTQDDLNSTFNGWIKSLVAVFEEISDAKKTLNKIKAMSTAKKATINEKYKPQVDFEPFVKLVILSNNAETLIKATEFDVRYWIRRLNPLTAEEYIPKFDARLQAETPAVLYTLATRQMATPDQSRMWFSHDAIKTDALAVVVENSLSDLAKTIKEWIADKSVELDGKEFAFTATELANQLREKDINAVSAALRKELKMEAKNTEYKPLDGGLPKKGRRYLVAGKTNEEIEKAIVEDEETPF